MDGGTGVQIHLGAVGIAVAQCLMSRAVAQRGSLGRPWVLGWKAKNRQGRSYKGTRGSYIVARTKRQRRAERRLMSSHDDELPRLAHIDDYERYGRQMILEPYGLQGTLAALMYGHRSEY